MNAPNCNPCKDSEACVQGRMCPARPSQPSRSSWRASDLVLALLFVGIVSALSAGVL